jgi:L-serine deaminase
VRGAIFQDAPHIVAIDDLWVDFPAAGHVLLALHHDRPGIIGAVGTLLGNADVNISFMHVGRRSPRSEAIMALGTDEATPSELQARIGALPHIQWLKAIQL